MGKLKIVHILNSVGGVDVSLRLILENIDSSKFESFVIHGDNDTQKPYINNIGESVDDYKISIQRNVHFIKDLKALNSAKSILKEIKPDLIHAHSAKGGIIAKAINKGLNIPVLHTPQAYSYLSAENKIKKELFLAIEKFFVGSKNKILASSESEKRRAIDEVGYAKDKVLLFNNSIKPINHLEPLSISKTWPDSYICSVGRPSYQKNIELMLDVLAKIKQSLPNIHLVLMGVGHYSPNLESVKNKIQLLSLKDNITLLDWTSREDIFNIVKNSQLYLTTARYEGLPYSVIESLALGKAIVATDADGNRDLVKDNYNGYLIYDEDAEKLARAVIEILNSEDKRSEFEKNSLELFYDKFDMTKNIELLEDIYRKEISK